MDIDSPVLITPIVKETAEPGTPAAGMVYIYAKADGLLYSKDDTGVETALGGGGDSLTWDFSTTTTDADPTAMAFYFYL